MNSIPLDIFYSLNGEWYFLTPYEKGVGPFNSKLQAEEGYKRFSSVLEKNQDEGNTLLIKGYAESLALDNWSPR